MATIQCGTHLFANVQAVMFDKDGTLADSQAYLRVLAQKRARVIDAQVPGVQEPLLLAFGVEGDRLNPAGLMAVGTRRENEIAAAAYVAETGRDWMAALNLVRAAFVEADQLFARKADHTPLFDGVLPVLQALVAAQVKLGILSSDSTVNVQDFVQRYQLQPYVHMTMGSGAISKPDPVLFQQACAAMGLAPRAVLSVGDSSADIDMARAAGAAGVVGVTWGLPLTLEGADVVVSTLADLRVVAAA
jgi:phosphoglycolate phosphatase